MDTLDGRYSRMSGKGTPFGAFLDSTLDRLEEGIVLTAVAAYFADQGDALAVAACVVAVLFSLMVSYTRARAEALGVECKVGIATRPVRVVILSIGLLFARAPALGDFELLAPAVYVLAALTLVTTIQRIAHVRRELNAPRARSSAEGVSRAVTGPRPRGSIPQRTSEGKRPAVTAHQRQRRPQRRGALPARQGSRRDRRRRQLRLGLRPGRRVLQGRRSRPATSPGSCTSTSAATTSATSSSPPPSTSTATRSARTSARRSGPARTTR